MLDRKFDTTCELIAGSNGIFDVEVDGTMVFSKHQVNRFPETAEVITAIENL